MRKDKKAKEKSKKGHKLLTVHGYYRNSREPVLNDSYSQAEYEQRGSEDRRTWTFSYTPASVTAYLTVLCEERNQSDLHNGIAKRIDFL